MDNCIKQIEVDEPELYEKIIYENEAKAYQLRLVVNEFRDKKYLHIRKYFLSYEGNFIPSSEGISIEADISSIKNLLDGLIEITSFAEVSDGFKTYYKKFIDI